MKIHAGFPLTFKKQNNLKRKYTKTGLTAVNFKEWKKNGIRPILLAIS
jgi:hypothetical protein